jgi:hypothetical protein
VGDDPAGGGEAGGLRRLVEVPPEDTGLGERGSGHRIEPHTAKQRKVDHDAAVVHRVAGHTVPAAPDRDQQIVLAGVAQRGDHIGGLAALCDHGRLAVDSTVPDLARLVERRIAASQHGPTEPRYGHDIY